MQNQKHQKKSRSCVRSKRTGISFVETSVIPCRTSNRHIAIPVAVLLAGLLFTSCGNGNGSRVLHPGEEAANIYKGFLAEVKNHKTLPIGEFIRLAKEWKRLDSLANLYLSQDTSHVSLRKMEYELLVLHDSVRSEFCRLAFSEPRSYRDVLAFKEAIMPCHDDTAYTMIKTNARPFFESLENRPIYKGSREKTLAAYRKFLDKHLRSGIDGRKGLLYFIREEEALFRGYLSHLSEPGISDTEDIIRKTEKCCLSAFDSVEDNPADYKEALVYLTIRTNRRLLQNARTCVDDIFQNRVMDIGKAQSYIWMMMQPFTAMDGFSLSMLSDREREELYRLADEMPDAIGKLNERLRFEKNRLSDMPAIFLKTMIAIQ